GWVGRWRRHGGLQRHGGSGTHLLDGLLCQRGLRRYRFLQIKYVIRRLPHACGRQAQRVLNLLRLHPCAGLRLRLHRDLAVDFDDALVHITRVVRVRRDDLAVRILVPVVHNLEGMYLLADDLARDVHTGWVDARRAGCGKRYRLHRFDELVGCLPSGGGRDLREVVYDATVDDVAAVIDELSVQLVVGLVYDLPVSTARRMSLRDDGPRHRVVIEGCHD